MSERRTLIEGLKAAPAIEPSLEKEFVFQNKSLPGSEGRGINTPKPTSSPPPSTARAPISSRIRADFAEALKRASLERQLAKLEPNSISDILEVALEPWLRDNGYLS